MATRGKTREQLLAEIEMERRRRDSFFGTERAIYHLPRELLNLAKSSIKSIDKAGQKAVKSKFGQDVFTALKRPLQEGSQTRKFLEPSARKFLNTKTGRGLLKGAEVLDIATSRIPAGIIKQKGNIQAGIKQGIEDPNTNLFRLFKEGGEKRGLPFLGIVAGIGAEILAPGPEIIRPLGKLSKTAAKSLSVAEEIAKSRGSISKFIPTGEAIPASRGARIAREGSNKSTTFIDTNPFTREVRFNPTRFDQVVEDVMTGKRIEIGGKGGVIFAKGGTEGRASVSRRLLNTVFDFEESRIRNVTLEQSGSRSTPTFKLDGLENTTEAVGRMAGRTPEQPLSIRTLARGGGEQPFPATKVEQKAFTSSSVFRTSDSIASIRSQTRGVVTDASAQRVARTLGLDADQILRLPNKPLTVEERVAVGGVVQENLNQLRAIEDQMYKFTSDSPQGLIVRQQLATQKIRTLKLLAKERSFGSEAGKTLRAEQITFQAISSQERRIVKFLNNPNISQTQKDYILNKVNDFVGSPKDMENLLRKLQPTSLTQGIVEVATAVKLWAIPTHLINTISAFKRLLIQFPIRIVSGSFDNTIGKLYGGNQERFVQDVMAEMQGQWVGWKTVGHHALEALKDENYALKLRKAEDYYGNYGPAIRGRLGKEAYLDSFLDYFGKAVRFPFRLLGVEDAIIRQPAQAGYLHTLVGREALKKGYKFGTENYNKFVAENILNPSADFLKKAEQEGDLILFQGELTGVTAEFNRLRQNAPAIKLVIPFFRTLANLTKEFIRFTPAAPVLLPSTRAALKTRGPAMDAIAKMTLGTTVLIPITMWIMEDDERVVLGAPENETEKDNFYYKYGGPYSIRIGDSYYPFNRFSPFAEHIIAAKILSDAIKNEDEESMTDVITDAFFTLSTNLLDKSAFISMSDALDALTDPESGRAKRFIHNLITGSIVPTIVSRAAIAIDPTIYETNTLGEAFLAKIPFATKKLNPRVDVFGKDLIRPSTGLVRFLSPSIPSKIKLDIVRKELEEMNYLIGFPGKEQFSQKLSDEQFREMKIISGRLIYDALFRLVTDPEWDTLNPAEKEKTVGKFVDTGREIAKYQIAKELYVINELKKALIKERGMSSEQAQKQAMELWQAKKIEQGVMKSEEDFQQYSAELDTPPITAPPRTNPPASRVPVPRSSPSLGQQLLQQR